MFYILKDLPLTAYYELANSKDISKCSGKDEKAVRKRIKLFTDQFLYTSEVILSDFFKQ